MRGDRILVTGGAGYIGQFVVQRLIETRRRVRVLELPEAGVDHLPLAQVEVVRGDIREGQAIQSSLDGCSAVVHLAANPNLWARRPRDFHDTNFRGACNVLSAAMEAGMRRFVHVSTESILTSPRSTTCITEQTPLRIEDAIGDYCRSKMRAELAALEFARRGLPVVIASPTVPVGPGDVRRGPLTRLMCHCAAGSIRAYVDAEINLIHVRDAADGIVAALDRGRVGARYLLSGETWTIKQLLDTVCQWCDIRLPRWRIPPAVALTFAWIEEQYCRLTQSRIPMATVTGVRLARRAQRFDGSATAAELTLKNRPCIEAIHEQLEWLASEGAFKNTRRGGILMGQPN